ADLEAGPVLAAGGGVEREVAAGADPQLVRAEEVDVGELVVFGDGDGERLPRHAAVVAARGETVPADGVADVRVGEVHVQDLAPLVGQLAHGPGGATVGGAVEAPGDVEGPAVLALEVHGHVGAAEVGHGRPGVAAVGGVEDGAVGEAGAGHPAVEEGGEVEVLGVEARRRSGAGRPRRAAVGAAVDAALGVHH